MMREGKLYFDLQGANSQIERDASLNSNIVLRLNYACVSLCRLKVLNSGGRITQSSFLIGSCGGPSYQPLLSGNKKIGNVIF